MAGPDGGHTVRPSLGDLPAAGSQALNLARSTFGEARRLGQRIADAWFAPKRFESRALYERLGVLLVKRYAPTGGDFFIRRYGVRIVDVRGDLDSLTKFERFTRRLEVIHEIAFLGFLGWSVWRAATRAGPRNSISDSRPWSTWC